MSNDTQNKNGIHYHFIGIGGIGMSALAFLCLKKGFIVSGSDLVVSPLIEKLAQEGALVFREQKKDNITAGMRIVYSSDICPNNSEWLQAQKLSCKILHRSDLLADLCESYRSFAVAGSHGKTTTASLLATVIYNAKKDPSFAIGGVLPAFASNAHAGCGQDFIFEADESDRSFLKYHPFGAIVTNVDHDHLVNYGGSEKELARAFASFISQVKSVNYLFYNGDDLNLSSMQLPGQSYGFDEKNDWKIRSYRQEKFATWFDFEHQGVLFEQIEIALSGQHNVMNSAAVFALAYSLGIDEDIIRDAFKQFKGVLRRCEHKGVSGNILFIDDYAHHPTEIRTTLEGIRSAMPESRLLVVFQPHRYTRTKDCLGKFHSVFNAASEVIITDIYAAGESSIPEITAHAIIEEIERNNAFSCVYVPRTALGHYLANKRDEYDVLITLGAGDITKLSGEVMALIEKR